MPRKPWAEERRLRHLGVYVVRVMTRRERAGKGGAPLPLARRYAYPSVLVRNEAWGSDVPDYPLRQSWVGALTPQAFAEMVEAEAREQWFEAMPVIMYGSFAWAEPSRDPPSPDYAQALG